MNYSFKIHYKEIIIIFAILFFTILSSYVNVAPQIVYFVKEDRWIQLLAVYVVSLSLILSFKSTIDIKLEYLINALIITLLFGFITKPKPKLAEKVKKEVKKIGHSIHEIDDSIHNEYESIKDSMRV
jgi:uncharacterized membrane protein